MSSVNVERTREGAMRTNGAEMRRPRATQWYLSQCHAVYGDQVPIVTTGSREYYSITNETLHDILAAAEHTASPGDPPPYTPRVTINTAGVAIGALCNHT